MRSGSGDAETGIGLQPRLARTFALCPVLGDPGPSRSSARGVAIEPDPVAPEQCFDLLEISLEGLALQCRPAFPERQGVMADAVCILRLGLKEQDVALELLVRHVAMNPQVEPGVQQGPEHLVENHRQAAIRKPRPFRGIGAPGPWAVQERSKGVVTDHKVCALLDGHIDVRGVANASIHVVDPVDACRLVEDRQRRGSLDGLGDRQLRVLVVAEHAALGGVQIASGEVEVLASLAREGRKFVRHPDPLKTRA